MFFFFFSKIGVKFPGLGITLNYSRGKAQLTQMFIFYFHVVMYRQLYIDKYVALCGHATLPKP